MIERGTYGELADSCKVYCADLPNDGSREYPEKDTMLFGELFFATE